MIESSKLYDALKYLALIAFPAVTAFAAVVLPLWEVPYTEQIIPTLAAANVLLGALVGISSAQHTALTKTKK